MPRKICVQMGLIVSLALCSTIVAAQATPHKITYNKSAEITVSGVIQKITDNQNGLLGTHLLLQVDGGTLDVHLGPSRGVSGLRANLAKGAQVEVVGAMAQHEGKPLLLAREIRSGDAVFQLRSPQGLPLRSRGGRQ